MPAFCVREEVYLPYMYALRKVVGLDVPKQRMQWCSGIGRENFRVNFTVCY